MSTPTPKEIQSQAKKSSAKFPGKVDESVHKCVLEEELTPIYPVRYAYANFFEETLKDPADPPALPDLLKAKDIPQGKGYMIRLLRKGWIWLKEEGGPFHIYKYEKIPYKRAKKYGKASYKVETFIKYLLDYDENKKSILVQDRSSGTGIGYPFIFVRKGVTKIRIAYTEHELNHDLILKLMGDSATREKCMQLVDLGPEKTTHSVKATEKNLKDLVEDYRERQDKFFQSNKSDEVPEKPSEDFDLSSVTTDDSYDLDSEDIIRVLRNKSFDESKKNEYLENARIVALFDPAGRQADIVRAHKILVGWQKKYFNLNTYPYTIGYFVDQLLNSKNKDVSEIANASINVGEHHDYWDAMQEEAQFFKDRCEKIGKLYTAFMIDSALTGKVGSLDTYLKSFFNTEPEERYRKLEVTKLATLGVAIFEGATSSQAFQKAMETIAGNVSEHEDLKNATNGLEAFLKVWTKVLTTDQDLYSISMDFAVILDPLLQHLGPFLGKIWGLGSAAHDKVRMSSNAYKLIAKNFMPKMLGKVFGLEFKGNKAKVSHDKIAKIVADIINDYPQKGNRIDDLVKSAETNLKRGQKLFDWADKKLAPDFEWILSDINSPNSGNKSFKMPGIETVCLCFDTGFGGLSALLNIKTIYEILEQSQYSDTPSTPVYSGFNLVSCISSLTADVITGSNALVQLGSRINIGPSSLKALAPACKRALSTTERLAGSQGVTKLIAVANFTGAIVSGWDAYKAYLQGNTGKAAGDGLVSGGSGVIFVMTCLEYKAAVAVGAAAGEAAVAEAAGLTVFGIIGIIALVVIGIGVGLSYYFSKSAFEHFLRNCFWGKGKKYAFWKEDKKRPPIASRLDRAQGIIDKDSKIIDYFTMEHQEFMNLFYMPKLKINKKLTKTAGFGINEYMHKFSFSLPNFQPGISQIQFRLYNWKKYPVGLFDIPGLIFNRHLTDECKTKVDELFKKPSSSSKQAGSTSLDNKNKTENLHAEFDIELKCYSEYLALIWQYKPHSELTVPTKFLYQGELLDEDDVIVEMLNEHPISKRPIILKDE